MAKAPYRTKGIVIETTTVYRHLEKMLKEGVVVGKEKQMDTKRKRAFSVAVGILFLFVIFASLFYIAEEENHNCTEIVDDMLEHEEKEYDEHVWLSLKNAQILCKAIAEALETVDPEHKDVYATNVDAYLEKLSSLDSQYQDAVANASQKTLLFGDRFPFRYLVDDYGLSYYAAFAGCSAESEASFETISFLAKKVDELGLKNIMTIENSDQKIAKTIRDNTKDKNQEILSLDSMQSTTSEDVKNGTTYLSVMESNLDVLKKAMQ